MNLTQVFTIWLLAGLTGVLIDQLQPENRNDYKGMSLFSYFVYLIAFIFGGGVTLSIALHEYLERNK